MKRWSARRLAELCGVSPDFVSRIKPEEVSSDDTVIGKDGVQQPARKPRKAMAPDDAGRVEIRRNT